MALPTPTPINVTSSAIQPGVVIKPTPAIQPGVVSTPTPAIPPEGTDLAGDATLDAQPTPPPVNEGAGIDKYASRHYQTSGSDIRDTNLTLPNGVRFFGHMGVCRVDLAGTGLDKIRLVIDGSYREIANGDKIICSRDDLVNLLRKPFIQELPVDSITLSA